LWVYECFLVCLAFVELFAIGKEGITQDGKGDNRHNQYVM